MSPKRSGKLKVSLPMSRTISLLLLSVSLLAQTPASLDKPPQDVDDALRARIKTFYDLHVEHKYRQAEQLIAEESKDDFYTMSKPQVSGFRIASIEYSDHFTKAKALIVGRMQALLPMFGPKEMDIPSLVSGKSTTANGAGTTTRSSPGTRPSEM